MPRHIPIRSCIVCRRRQEKPLLTRIIMSTEGIIHDPTGKQNGRGAYLCSDVACWHQAATSNLLAKALRQPLLKKDRQVLVSLAAEIVSPRRP